MIKKISLVLLTTFIATLSYSQSTNDLMIGGQLDFLKTDNHGILEKIQTGFEANFFVKRNFTVTAGAELWTESDDSFVFGTRWYFNDNFFSRFRGLIGDNDFSVGIGGVVALNTNWRFEMMGDYYFAQEFAVRFGVAYVIRL